MMLFTRDDAKLILSGEKTITARLWKREPPLKGSIQYANTNRQKDSKFARLIIVDVWEWYGEEYRVDDIIAKRVGFKSPEDFLAAYKHLNAKNWDDPDKRHWFIEFVVAEKYKEADDL